MNLSARIVSLLGAAFLATTATCAQAPSKYPTAEGDYVAHDFKFKSGEQLPELRLHYRTLGKLMRDAQGRPTNAVLILHGTGGSGQQFLQPQFAGELFGSWPTARHQSLLHHPARRHWPWEIFEAQRRNACAFSAVRL